MHLTTLILAILFLLKSPSSSCLQAQDTNRHLDFFVGVDFNYRDINYVRQWDVLLNLTPGFKYDFGHNWMLSGQAIVPIINQYGNYYERTRLNMAVLSKEFWLADIICAKASAGWFGLSRYGVDAKLFAPLSEWVAVESQLGYTGYVSMATGWEMSPMDRFTWTFGGDLYFPEYDVQLRGIIGRFVYGDFGILCEGMRHFKHTTVSLFGKLSSADGLDAGFKAAIMVPPYHRSTRMVRIRPASNFRFTSIIKYHQHSVRMYPTDPEENEREGWFTRSILRWGSHNMEADFTTQRKEVSE